MKTLQCFLFLILLFEYTDSQTAPCESTAVFGNSGGTPTIVVSLTEASAADLATNPDSYIADTKINGILGGSSSSTGITLQIATSSGTPRNINVTTQFSLESRTISPPENTFSERAFVRLIKPLNRDGQTATTFDDTDVIEMQVQCTRVGSTSSTFFLLTVDVQDINDNSPIFSGTPYYVSVNELTPIGTTIFRGIAAYDLDANTNKDIHFGIMPGDGVTQPTTGLHDATDKFQIATPRLGDITIKSTLDFEKVKKYVFRISATDQATNSSLRHTSTVTMTIDVSDGDDLGPVFYYNGCFQVDDVCFNPTYMSEISRHSTTAQLILRGAENQSIINSIIARDQDTLNARIQLSIVETLPPGYKDKFTLINTTNTGTFSSVAVTQIEPLGSSDVNILKIIIKATELTDNRLFSRAVVDVHIYPSNSSCLEKDNVNTCTMKSCSNVASIVGAVLGILLAIVITILVILIMKLRNQGCSKEQQTPMQQNNGLSLGHTVESRQSSSEYDEIGMRSPANHYDELHNDHQYMEPS
ncbi:protocadherin-15 [Mytilus galloprovincialis]|uniref:Protocadherin-15 n=1 Tax=Mytilus galloprovincialis TaxID=29158 RepID=A0A8B6CX91_MYTGA|nr:protocadherin-15 [Mytilus galloprovincialis]